MRPARDRREGHDDIQAAGGADEAFALRVMVQAPIVGFREVTSPDAWRIEVVVGGVVWGHIYRGGGTYRYFEGPRNDVTWSFADLDLERLEARIRATVIAERPSGQPRAELARQPD